jgi:hypothetical protein
LRGLFPFAVIGASKDIKRPNELEGAALTEDVTALEVHHGRFGLDVRI